MKYEGIIYRPPSEARSLLIQVTIGCSHNKCTFCSMYQDKQFRIRKLEDILNDIDEIVDKESITKVFLCDGDALVVPTNDLIVILKKIKQQLPNVKQVSSYATFQDIQRKSLAELTLLYENGLTLLYLGAESGLDLVLNNINKKISAQEMIEASKKAQAAKMKLSIMIIVGLGGKALSREHAQASATLLNHINPDFVGLLTLMIIETTPLYQQVQENKFIPLTPRESIEEIRIIIENLEITNCLLSSSHISNYLNIKGYFREDKAKVLNEIDNFLIQNKELKEGYQAL
ncbi:B12-binding domain-containing radical SAM protein [Erysipelotrichaceae bacterium OttesenSCG-928-M19]|nr:B12-binding domain-containing radical SAM protein [Erysipelotrichaceae bacterium OttesenSCG-928-M19]